MDRGPKVTTLKQTQPHVELHHILWKPKMAVQTVPPFTIEAIHIIYKNPFADTKNMQ